MLRAPARRGPVGHTLASIAGALALSVWLAGCQDRPRAAGSADASDAAAATETVPVSGTAVHFFSTQIVHSRDSTASGVTQRSSDIVELSGDLTGYVLYHPTSRFDFAAGTLVNTGTQIFSGTIAGSGPVILRDDTFRFEVDLATGAVTGTVHLVRTGDARDAGPWTECRLTVTGTGRTPAGDATAEYRGECARGAS